MTSLYSAGSLCPLKEFGESSIVFNVHGFILTPLLYFGPIVSLVLVSLVLLVILSINVRKKHQLSRALRFVSSNSPTVITSSQASNLNRDPQPVENKAVFSLLVIQSVDKVLIGQRFDFCKGSVYLGSSSMNDFFSSKDLGTKKGHAVITFCDGNYFLIDGKPQADLAGQLNTPTDIYLNDRPVSGETLINHGDLIRLGATLLLCFEC